MPADQMGRGHNHSEQLHVRIVIGAVLGVLSVLINVNEIANETIQSLELRHHTCY